MPASAGETISDQDFASILIGTIVRILFRRPAPEKLRRRKEARQALQNGRHLLLKAALES